MRVSLDVTPFRILAVAVVVPFACLQRAQANDLLLADGTKVAATLADASADGHLAFAAAGKRIVPDGRDLVRWGSFASPVKNMLAVLDGGALLAFSQAALEGDKLRLKGGMCGEVQLPIAAARGLVFHPPVAALARDRLLDDLAQWRAKDQSAGVRVILDNGDAVLGTLASLDAATLAVDTPAGRLDLAVDRVRALAIGRTSADDGRAPSGVRYVVGAADGSRVAATEVRMAESGLQLTTTWGETIALARENVAAIQTLGGRATYLSDMRPSGYKHVPYLAMAWPLANDRSVGGERLRADGREYLKGLGMHSAASVTYALDRAYRRFDAELAVDDSVFAEESATTASSRRPQRGSVVFRVYTDAGDGKWQLRHTSKTIRGGDKPTPIAVDLAGAKRLSLIVDFADRADEWDRAAWLDARLVE